MKTMFIPVKSRLQFDFQQFEQLNLPKNLIIAYSIQFQSLAVNLREYLIKKHVILSFIQVLGCSNPKLPPKAQAIILLSTGKFHAISLAYETSLPVYLLENNKLLKIDQKEIDLLGKRKKGAYLNFLNSSILGIIVSNKPGQENLKQAISLKKNLTNKHSYLFITNNIDTGEFENFWLPCWINTACPRMDLNLPIVNITDLTLKN